MDKSTIQNKMLDLDTDNKISVKFNVAMHGFAKDQVARYNSLPDRKKILIRRRLADNDNSVEVFPEVKTAPKKAPSKSTEDK